MGLLEMSISGAVFILAVIVVRAATVNWLPKKTFLVLWGIVLLQLLIPLRIPSVFSIYSWIPEYMEDAAYAPVPSKTEGRNKADSFSNLERPDHEEESSLISDIRRSGLEGRQESVSNNNINIWKIVWVCGFGLCLLYYIAAYFRCRMHFRTSVTVKNEFVEGWLQAYGGMRPVQIRQSGFVKAPLTYGLLHPVILMPEHTDWEDSKRLSYILAHEAVHIRRFDILTKSVLAAALAIHWFNPMVWIMYVLCNRDLEMSCDETVVRMFGETERAEYARILIYMEEKKSMPAPFCSNFNSHAMQERILAIMMIRKRSGKTVIAAAILVCMLAGMFATSAAVSKEQQVRVASMDIKEQQARIAAADAKERQVHITNISLNLGNRRAEDISDALIEHMKKRYEGRYEFQNFEVTFSKEVIQGDTLSLDIDLYADMTLIRNPNDSAYVEGMKKAIEKITDTEKKKEAEALYEDYLDEVMPYYMQPERTGFLYQVHLPAASAGDEAKNPVYELFYRGGEDDSLIALEEEEDAADEEVSDEADGMAYIEEQLLEF